MCGSTDGWFDDPIGLSARAYILIPLNALSKSLLAQPYFIPQIKVLSDPQAYALLPHWLLLSITKLHSHAPLQNIHVPLQQAYVLTSHWMPRITVFSVTSAIPFMTS